MDTLEELLCLYTSFDLSNTSFMSQFEDFFNGEILGGKKYLRDLSKGNAYWYAALL